MRNPREKQYKRKVLKAINDRSFYKRVFYKDVINPSLYNLKNVPQNYHEILKGQVDKTNKKVAKRHSYETLVRMIIHEFLNMLMYDIIKNNVEFFTPRGVMSLRITEKRETLNTSLLDVTRKDGKAFLLTIGKSNIFRRSMGAAKPYVYVTAKWRRMLDKEVKDGHRYDPEELDDGFLDSDVIDLEEVRKKFDGKERNNIDNFTEHKYLYDGV